MPNVTIFIQQEVMPPVEGLSELTRQCSGLCVEVLKAAPENVHVIYVPVYYGRGKPVFAEVRYRLNSFRTRAVMDSFMEELDEAIRRSIGHTARIRCFGYAESTIHARN